MSTHTLHSQHDRWEKKPKKNIILIFNSVVTTDKQQQGFWGLPLLSSALTPLPLMNPFLPGTHFNPVAPMSITLFPLIPLLRPWLRTLEHRMSRLQRALSTTKQRRESKKVQRWTTTAFITFIPNTYTRQGNKYSDAHMQTSWNTIPSFLPRRLSNQLKLFNH